jgi:hypothetical protein
MELDELKVSLQQTLVELAQAREHADSVKQESEMSQQDIQILKKVEIECLIWVLKTHISLGKG